MNDLKITMMMPDNHHHRMMHNPCLMKQNAIESQFMARQLAQAVNGSYTAWRGEVGQGQGKVGGGFGPHKVPGSSWNRRVHLQNRKESVMSDGSRVYNPPEMQAVNRNKAWKAVVPGFKPKRKFNGRKFKPYAPRNTTSFLIRAKEAGGIASLVSPATPAVLVTPVLSPFSEILGDIAKQEWGVDHYGSMNGLIRLRSDDNQSEELELEDGDSDESGCSGADSVEHLEVERRLDLDLSRFEMVNLNEVGVEVEHRFDEVNKLENENLNLKERLFAMDREMEDLKRRMDLLERQYGVNGIEEQVKENNFELDVVSFSSGEGHGYKKGKSDSNVDLCMGGFNGALGEVNTVNVDSRQEFSMEMTSGHISETMNALVKLDT